MNLKLQKMLRDDLGDVFRGNLATENVRLSGYSTDSSLWERQPLAAVAPRDTSELLVLLAYAREKGFTLHSRGAGLGVTGESLGSGIIVDFSQHFRRLVSLGHETVTVQAGMTLGELQMQLSQVGRGLPGFQAEAEAMTLGGWLSGLALSGSPHRPGLVDTIHRVQMLKSDSTVVELGSVSSESLSGDDEKDDRLRQLLMLVSWRSDLFGGRQAGNLLDVSGLVFSGVLGENRQFNPHRLVSGARGTLGMLLELTLETVPLKPWSVYASIGFDLPERAADAAMKLPLLEKLESAEILDWRSIALASEANDEIRRFFPLTTPSSIVARWSCTNETTTVEIQKRLGELFRPRSVYVITETALGRGRLHPLAHWRAAARQALAGRPMAGISHPVFEEIVVRPEHVSSVLSQIAGAAQAARLAIGWQINPLVGRIQARPLFEPLQELNLEQIGQWVHAVTEIVNRSGGMIRGVEPWIGRVRGSAITRQYADMKSIWQDIRNLFDPEGRFHAESLPGSARPSLRFREPTDAPSPGKSPEQESKRVVVIDQDSEESTIDRFPSLPVLDPELNWPENQGPQVVASACNACGACRSTSVNGRMCPSFRGDRAEASSPRALAGLIRQVTTGTLDPTLWGSEKLKEAAEACFHCQMCKSECQAGIDISALMIETKSAAVANYGLSHKDFWLSRVDMLASTASLFPVIANAILNHSRSRWVLEKVTGLSRYRRLPKVRRWSFLRRADRRGWCRQRPQTPGPRVALFLDILANHFHQDLAETTVEYLKWAGVNVYIPYRQYSSGMPALVVGDLDRARELVRANLRTLGNAVRDGYTIVCIEPTSAMVLRDFYPRLTDDLDARLVADNTLELTAYLAGMADRGLLPGPTQQISGHVGYHQPCHQRALGMGKPGHDLVSRLPGMNIEFIDRGCSGIAGPFGVARTNFRKSLRIGYHLRTRLKDTDIDAGMTECLSCRMQMEQGIPKRTLHPVEYLAMAAGLNPTLRAAWNRPKPRNMIS